jgi:WD40 repeat protein
VLVSGHDDGHVAAWDPATGERLALVHAHMDPLWARGGPVYALAVAGPRLLSGSLDSDVKVWCLGPGPDWPLERALSHGPGGVSALAAWGGRAASGGADAAVLVWDLGTGAAD